MGTQQRRCGVGLMAMLAVGVGIFLNLEHGWKMVHRFDDRIPRFQEQRIQHQDASSMETIASIMNGDDGDPHGDDISEETVAGDQRAKTKDANESKQEKAITSPDSDEDQKSDVEGETQAIDEEVLATTPFSREEWKEVYDTSPLISTLNETASLLDKVGWPPVSLLKSIADEKRRLVVVTVNCPYIELADNMIQSLINVGLNNYVIIPSTWDVHDILVLAYGQEHVLPPLPGFRLHDRAAGYNLKAAFGALTKIRPVFIRAIISKGFGVYYSDSDTVWMANAFDDVEDEAMVVKTEDGGKDVVAVDFQVSSDDGLISKQTNYCSCQLYFRPTPGSIQFLEEWMHEAETNEKHREDQMAMNVLLRQYKDGKRTSNSTTWEARLAPDPFKHPPGNGWFQRYKEDKEKQNQAVIVHNNWLVGIKQKEERLQEFGLWHPTGKLTDFVCGEGEQRVSVTIAPPSAGQNDENPTAEDESVTDAREVSRPSETSEQPTTEETATSVAEEDVGSGNGTTVLSEAYSREHWKEIYDTAPLTSTLNESSALLDKVGWPPISLLETTADSRRRLVVVSVNCAYIELADNLIQSLTSMGLENYVIISSTWDVHDILVDAYGQNHVLPPIPGFRLPNGEADWAEGVKFAALTKIRPVFVRSIVSKDFSVYYSDSDTVWLGNAFDDVEDMAEDLQVSSDDGIISRLKNYCSCQLYFRPTPGSLQFLDEWIQEGENSKHREDQMAMNSVIIRYEAPEEGNERTSSWTARLAPDPYKHPPGNSWFQRDRNDAEKHSQAVIVHNNWNRNGFNDKVQKLKDLNVWHPTGKLTSFTCGEGREKMSVTVTASEEQEGETDPDGKAALVEKDDLEESEKLTEERKQTDVEDNLRPSLEDMTENDKRNGSVACENHPPLDVVYDCLRLTTPNLTLEYPEDAFQHFKEIQEALGKWKPSEPHKWMGYEGPWIENVWIEFAENRTSECLSDTFGPFIPILLPWTDLWVGPTGGSFRYPAGFVDAVKAVLRPNVPYVTLVQSAEGLTAKDEFPMEDIPNVLVFSSGGYGHVPIPLFKQEEPLAELSDERKYLINYVGSLGHDPWEMRKKMDSYLKQRLSHRYRYAQAPNWREIMQDSWISLTPRGFGRTAFHVVEAIQMGLIPVHVYNQTKWVPYGDVFEEVGFAITLDELPALVDELEKWTTQDFLDREKMVAEYRETHFMPGAVMIHVQNFLTRAGKSDLVCQPLPSTTTMS